MHMHDEIDTFLKQSCCHARINSWDGFLQKNTVQPERTAALRFHSRETAINIFHLMSVNLLLHLERGILLIHQ